MFKYIRLLSFGPGGNNNGRNEIVNASNILEETLETLWGGTEGRVCDPEAECSLKLSPWAFWEQGRPLGNILSSSCSSQTPIKMEQYEVWQGQISEMEGKQREKRTPEVAILEDWDLGSVEEKGEVKSCLNILCKK